MTHQDPHSHSADAVREHRPIEAQYVRQGRGGRRMLVLLVVSAGAAAILLLGWWAINNASLRDTEDAAAMAPALPAVAQTERPAPAGPEATPPPVEAPAAP